MDEGAILGIEDIRTDLDVLSLSVDRLIELQNIENSTPDPTSDYLQEILNYRKTLEWDCLEWVDEPIEEVHEKDFEEFEEYYEANRMREIDLNLRELTHRLREKKLLPSSRPENPIENYPAKRRENVVEVEENLERIMIIRQDFQFAKIYITKKEQARSMFLVRDIKHRLKTAFPFLGNDYAQVEKDGPLRLRHHMVFEAWINLLEIEDQLKADLTRWSYSLAIYYLVRRWWWNLRRRKSSQRD